MARTAAVDDENLVMEGVQIQTTAEARAARAKVLRRALALLALAASSALPVLTGCGSGVAAPGIITPPSTGAGVSGVLMGGQQPVAGVSVQLYQASLSGYAAASTALGPAVLTSSTGNFTLPSYTCTAGSELYVAGTGGQPIAAAGGNPAITNNNLAMMAGLGVCGGSGASGFINVNELTTVATVYALAPFMSGVANVGAPASNQLGLSNAFDVINQVVDIRHGTLNGPALPAGATLPAALINTLADILEVCINSGGGSASDTTDGQTNGTPCGKLFFLTQVSGAAPANTVNAMLNLATHPGNNVAKLNQLRSTSPVFTPALSVNTPPSAFTIGITYTGGGAIASPVSLATDASGNVWVANGASSVVKLATTGAPLFTVSGGGTQGTVAIDPSGNAWITDSTHGSLVMVSAAGDLQQGFPISFASPRPVGIDGGGYLYTSSSTAGQSYFGGYDPNGASQNGGPYPFPPTLALAATYR